MNFERAIYKSKREWLEARGFGIGGSDASSIVGLNPYKTNLQLYQEKLKIIIDDFQDNRFTIYGKQVEPYLRGIFESDYLNYIKLHHKENEILIRKDKPYLRASLDGEILVLDDFKFTTYFKQHFNRNNEEPPKPMNIKKGMKGILEIKTTEVLSSMSKEKWHNAIPENYYCQCLHYLNVSNYDFVILMAQLTFEDSLGIRTKEIRYYGFMKDDKKEDLEYLEKEEDRFWNDHILKKIEPPLKIFI